MHSLPPTAIWSPSGRFRRSPASSAAVAASCTRLRTRLGCGGQRTTCPDRRRGGIGKRPSPMPGRGRPKRRSSSAAAATSSAVTCHCSRSPMRSPIISGWSEPSGRPRTSGTKRRRSDRYSDPSPDHRRSSRTRTLRRPRSSRRSRTSSPVCIRTADRSDRRGPPGRRTVPPSTAWTFYAAVVTDLVVGTSRPEVRSRIDSDHQLDLGPLDLAAVTELCRYRSSRALFRRSGGHPLLLAALQDSPADGTASTLADAVSARVDSLGPGRGHRPSARRYSATMRPRRHLPVVDVALVVEVLGRRDRSHRYRVAPWPTGSTASSSVMS